MAVFKAGCPNCGARVQLHSGELRLVVGRRSFYAFTCSNCGEGARRPAGDRIVELLTRQGVPVMRLHVSS